MSTLNYYSSRSRASARQDKIRNEMTKSSPYFADNGLDSIYGKSSYDSMKAGSSYLDTGGRTARARTRDHSADCYVKPSYRSGSIDLATPRTPVIGMRATDYTIPSPRIRDRSTDLTVPRSIRSSDFSINGIERLRNRPKITSQDDDERSQEYKNIMAKTEKHLSTCQDGVINRDLEISRDEMCDMIQNSDLSTKTINAINKEIFSKDGKEKKKNYSWRKDMEGYEDKWEKLNERSNSRTRDSTNKDTYSKTGDYCNDYKRNLNSEVKTVNIEIKPSYGTDTSTTFNGYKNRNIPSYESTRPINNQANKNEEENPQKKGSRRKDFEGYEEQLDKLNARSNSRTRDFSFNDTLMKSKDYKNEPKMNTESNVRTVQIEIKPNYVLEKNETNNSPIYKSTKNSDSHINNYEEAKPPKKGSWRKDMANYEDDLEMKKLHKDTQKKIDTYNNIKELTKEECNMQNEEILSIKTVPIKVIKPELMKNVPIQLENDKKLQTAHKEHSAVDVHTKASYNSSKPFQSKENEQESKTLVKDDKEEKTTSVTIKLNSSQIVIKPIKKEIVNNSDQSERKVDAQLTMKTSKSTSMQVDNTERVNMSAEAVKQKGSNTKTVKPVTIVKTTSAPTKVDKDVEPKPVPKWKKTSEPVKVVEVKVETPKPVPKWKKPIEPATVEDTKVETPKLVPKWKKPSEPVKVEETKVETPKSAHKWKKPSEPVKVEEKIEATKLVPKWKKPSEPIKKEEEKIELSNSIPNRRKPSEPVKVEETKAETPKSLPKWKKPSEPVKVEEARVETLKAVPKWKKPSEAVTKEDEKNEIPKPVLKWKKPLEPVKKEEAKIETPKSLPKWKKTSEAGKVEEAKIETAKSVPKWKKPSEPITVEVTKVERVPQEKLMNSEEKQIENSVSVTKSENSSQLPNIKIEVSKTEKSKGKITKEKNTNTDGSETKQITEHKDSRTNLYDLEENKPMTSNSTTNDGKSLKSETKMKSTECKLSTFEMKDSDNKDDNAGAEEGKTEKKIEEVHEEEEDISGMKAMRKETDDKFANMEAEFEAGRSKLAALRARIRKTREMAKASSEADAAADLLR